MKYHNIEIEELVFQMNEIPMGEIQMNDDRTKKKWTVSINRFLLAIFPVTQELYLKIMGTSPSTFKGNKRPVESLCWMDAAFFCNHLSLQKGLNPCYHLSEKDGNMLADHSQNGYRLPTEAEWQ